MADAVYVFAIVGKNDNPIYEAESVQAGKVRCYLPTIHLRLLSVQKDDNTHLNQFILHSALDMVEETEWTVKTMCVRKPCA